MALSEYLLREFAVRCQIALDLCVLHKELFDRNISPGYMRQEPFYNIWGRINNATLEHSLLQIVKLHDPLSQKIKGELRYNLGIQYILHKGEWATEIYSELEKCSEELNSFYENIKTARNWTLCHNDVASIVARDALGAFEKDADEPYFVQLERFLDIAHKNLLGENFVFEKYLKADVEMFIRHFNRV